MSVTMHPEQVGPQQRKANLSPLMVAKGKASLGERVNFCKFGCTDEDLDDNGYCRHLVGFTIPGNEKLYEPMVMNEKGRRLVQVKYVEKNGKSVPVYEEVQKGDKLERITNCSRVYRDVPMTDAELEEKTRPEQAEETAA